jgi:uncharacterized protein YjbI with pentapeptide repeats
MRRGAKAAVLVLGAIVLLAAIAVGAYFGGKWLWGELAAYIRPGDATERKDLVNIFVLIGAGIVATLTALAALLNAYFTRRNLQNAREALRQQRNLEEQRAQEDTLQAYFEQMGKLLTEQNPTETKSEHDPIRLLARAQTLTSLERLDPMNIRASSNKRLLLLYLYDAGLIDKDNMIVDLANANLIGADLSGAALINAHLRSVDLTDANLSDVFLGVAELGSVKLGGASLKGADFGGTNLSGAYIGDADLRDVFLMNADLSRANLSGANLDEVNLGRAELGGADVSGANLSGANLSGADLVNGNFRDAKLSRVNLSFANVGGAIFRGANLSGADLNNADLSSTVFRDANLSFAKLGFSNLRRADLTDAELTDADFRGADLSDARITEKQLSSCKSLAGATMPNGQKYEDWRKDKEGRGEGGENSGPS